MQLPGIFLLKPVVRLVRFLVVVIDEEIRRDVVYRIGHRSLDVLQSVPHRSRDGTQKTPKKRSANSNFVTEHVPVDGPVCGQWRCRHSQRVVMPRVPRPASQRSRARRQPRAVFPST